MLIFTQLSPKTTRQSCRHFDPKIEFNVKRPSGSFIVIYFRIIGKTMRNYTLPCDNLALFLNLPKIYCDRKHRKSPFSTTPRAHRRLTPLSEEPPRISTLSLHCQKLEFLCCGLVTFLPLTVCVYLHSNVRGRLRKQRSAAECVMTV